MENPEHEIERLRLQVEGLSAELESCRQREAASAEESAAAAASSDGSSHPGAVLGGGTVERRQGFGVANPLSTGVVRLATNTLPANLKFPKPDKTLDFMEERQTNIAWLMRFTSFLRRDGLGHVIAPEAPIVPLAAATSSTPNATTLTNSWLLTRAPLTSCQRR